jgi:hypothetical protein
MFQDRSTLASSTSLYAYKTADETVTSSDVLQNDNELTLTLDAGATYVFKVNLFLDSTVGTVSGYKISMGGTVIADNFRGFSGAYTATSFVEGEMPTTVSASLYATTANAIHEFFVEGSIEVTTAGTLLVQWAQNTSDPTAATVYRGSSLIAWRVA